jgi:hypothetical protein
MMKIERLETVAVSTFDKSIVSQLGQFSLFSFMQLPKNITAVVIIRMIL